MPNHGVYVSEQATSVGTPITAKVGIPFVIGTAPVQRVESPAAVGDPVLCTSFEEAVEKLGYSDNWSNYNLCEFMYSHFKLYGCQPVIFVNMLATSTMKSAVVAADKQVINHKVKLPTEAINDSALVIKAAGGTGGAYEKDTDYSTYYDGENLVIELLSNSSHYTENTINVAYNAVIPASVDNTAVATGLENIEKCLTVVGIVPDLICAPGYSMNSEVAAVMATKAAGINGMFKAKALIDISTAAVGGADEYSKVAASKAQNNFTDEDQIVCWPLLKLGNRVFHFSTQLAGLIAQVDIGNGGSPYESPSNKKMQCDSLVTESGKEVKLTLAQANILNAAGIMTSLNFMGGFVAWGNYTACYPSSIDVKDYLIPVSRMFDWVGNTLITTFWSKLDKPMNRRLIDSILDTCNIWLNGLVGSGYLLGARAEFRENENPLTSLMAGIIKIHLYITPPSPAQEIDFVLEYDADYVTAALSS
ncbi:MAG: Phage tail sheath protein [Eubacterium sp.]|jgi:phage tail sheath protein FI|nr:Phage tail sheath protein [Eubacterium sp.]